MTSTIANIDVEELVYSFSGLIISKIVVVSEPQTHFESTSKNNLEESNMDEDIED